MGTALEGKNLLPEGFLLNHVFLFKGNIFETICRLYMKDANKPGCSVKFMQIGPTVKEDMAVERFNNGYLGTSHVTGCE